jgi:hypothetical protein
MEEGRADGPLGATIAAQAVVFRRVTDCPPASSGLCDTYPPAEIEKVSFGNKLCLVGA